MPSMEILPSPPTDNIYKFAAILGLWFATLLLGIFIVFAYVTYKSSEGMKRAAVYGQNLNSEFQVSQRLEAIESGRLSEARLTWMLPNTPIDQERKMLADLRTRLSTSIAEFEALPEDPVVKRFKEFSGARLEWTLVVVVLLAVIPTLWGFFRWYKRVQLPSEKMLAIELQIKELELARLERESKTRMRFRVKTNVR